MLWHMPLVPVAALDLGTLLPAATAAVAVAGIIFAALRYNREDASAVVAQQSTVLADMKSLNDELHESLVRARAERDALLLRVGECDARILDLNDQIAVLARAERELVEQIARLSP